MRVAASSSTNLAAMGIGMGTVMVRCKDSTGGGLRLADALSDLVEILCCVIYLTG